MASGQGNIEYSILHVTIGFPYVNVLFPTRIFYTGDQAFYLIVASLFATVD